MFRGRSVVWIGITVVGVAAFSGRAAETSTSLAPTDVRVQIALRAQGHLFAAAVAGSEPIRQPIALDARFEFLEEAALPAGRDTVVRRYVTARADIETDGQARQQQLAADARELHVRLEGTTPRPFLATGFLSRDEAELLDVPFDPLLADGLRPEQPVAPGDSWKLPGDLVAGLLAIDTVQSGNIEATLTDVADARAVVSLRGTVVGAVDGVATRIELSGRAIGEATATDERSWHIAGPMTTIEATINERREAGWIAPGLEIQASITVHRSPSTGAADLSTASDGLAPAAADRPAGKGRPGVVWHRHRHGRYSAVLDARWRVVEDGPEGLVLRLTDRGKLVAQCSIVPLPRVAADAAADEATVRDDVRRSLGEQFGLITESEATTRADGTRLVRVVAEGAADGRAFRWVHSLLTDPAGHQLAVTFMHEPALADQFAAADQELVAGLVVLPDTPVRRAAAPSGPAKPR